jgi:hypothetical protein
MREICVAYSGPLWSKGTTTSVVGCLDPDNHQLSATGGAVVTMSSIAVTLHLH